MTNKNRLFLIGLALMVLMFSSLACDNTGNDTENTIPDTGVTEADEIIEDTADAINDGISAMCKACTLVNGEGSDSCSGVCK